ncbi:MAG TPA: hypothetical protein VF789_25475 [Thermoanaerobaculia bacterium]
MSWDVDTADAWSDLNPATDYLDFGTTGIQWTRNGTLMGSWGTGYTGGGFPCTVRYKSADLTISSPSPGQLKCERGQTPAVVWTAHDSNGFTGPGGDTPEKEKDKRKPARA